MKVAVPKERWEHETRVAASPESTKKLIGLGLDVVVETGAGKRAQFSDEAYQEAGASIAPNEAQALEDADIVFKVQRPQAEELAMMKEGAALVALLAPYGDRDGVQKYAEHGINAFAMEFMPRISRARCTLLCA